MGPEDLLPGDWIAGPMVVMGAPDENGVETSIPEDLADEIIAMEHRCYARLRHRIRDSRHDTRGSSGAPRQSSRDRRVGRLVFRWEHYAIADEAWNEAFEAAEQLNGAQELERLAQAYGW